MGDGSERPDVEVIGGVERRDIVIVEDDPAWAERFVDERLRIVSALRHLADADSTGLRIEHVGSTAVPGLAAKPIVDVQVSVPDVEDESAYLADLEGAGYLLRVRERGHRLLRTPELDVHVHVCGVGSDWERRHLLFRDWLRVDAADRATYERIKLELAKRSWPTMQHYADAKGEIIARIMARAESWATETGWAVGA